MWWSAFSYNKKGPYYIWPKESDAIRKERERQQTIVLTNQNNARYTEDKASWELTKPMSRLRVKGNVPKRKPAFRYKENRIYVLKDGKGGINWFQHQDKVLKPYLLPFVYKYRQGVDSRKDMIVIEDGALGH